MTQFAAALSQHPLPAQALGEVVGQVLETLGPGSDPDLAMLFVTPPFSGAVEDMVAVVRTVLRPGALLGATAASVVGGRHEIEEQAAVSLWAGRLPGRGRPVRLSAERTGDGFRLVGLVPDDLAGARTLMLLADPFTFPTDVLLEGLRASHPELSIVGGLASAARGPGGNRLVLDSAVVADGAVGILLDTDVAPATVVSQGCRPLGEAFIVTKAERNVIYELGGRPALERLQELAASLSPEERALMAQGVHVGMVIDERKADFERGDFLIRNLMGADRAVGAIAVGDEVEVGTTVQFQVRDAMSADEDLREMLAGAAAETADAALVFTCNGRGTHLFGVPHHDAEVISDAVGTDAVAGMSCAGELGPIGGRSFLHGFTASVALFTES